MTRTVRRVLVVLGVLAAAYGAWLLLRLGLANTLATLVWLVGGVVLHDGVFAVAVLIVSGLALRLVPRERLAPYVVALVILVPVTLVGIPELGRFGARADNPTLLDRNYWLGWSILVTLVVVAATLGALLSAHLGARPEVERDRTSGGDDGAGTGGR